ncbi:MAG: cytochrome c maturation protein CcmE [Bdellovibrionales bacterium]
MTPKARMRLYGILLFMAGFGAAAGLTLYALKDNISYFRTPSEIAGGNYPERASGRGIRLGGLVEEGSLRRAQESGKGEDVTFRVTDLAHTVTVHYRGLVPDLFREGQGVIAEGKMAPDGTFIAQRLLAKHDEKYMPPEVARTLHRPEKP